MPGQMAVRSRSPQHEGVVPLRSPACESRNVGTSEPPGEESPGSCRRSRLVASSQIPHEAHWCHPAGLVRTARFHAHLTRRRLRRQIAAVGSNRTSQEQIGAWAVVPVRRIYRAAIQGRPSRRRPETIHGYYGGGGPCATCQGQADLSSTPDDESPLEPPRTASVCGACTKRRRPGPMPRIRASVIGVCRCDPEDMGARELQPVVARSRRYLDARWHPGQIISVAAGMHHSALPHSHNGLRDDGNPSGARHRRTSTISPMDSVLRMRGNRWWTSSITPAAIWAWRQAGGSEAMELSGPARGAASVWDALQVRTFPLVPSTETCTDMPLS